MTDDAYRDLAREALADAGFVDARLCDVVPQPHLLPAGAARRRARRARGRGSQTHRGGPMDLPGNRVFYLALPPVAFPSTIERLGDGRAEPAEAGPVSSSRSRSARTSSRRTPLNELVAQLLRRVADLPHRPLPRQGDGAEPAGVPLRQPDLRVERGIATGSRPSRSPSPRISGSAAAPATTSRPGRCATWCRTTSPSC